MDKREPGTLVCSVCNELFCLTCGAKFSEKPAPHSCEIDELTEWEKTDPPPCFECLLSVVNP